MLVLSSNSRDNEHAGVRAVTVYMDDVLAVSLTGCKNSMLAINSECVHEGHAERGREEAVSGCVKGMQVWGM